MKDNRGFSLVELLVVVAIMSILAGAGVQMFGLVQNGNVKKASSLLTTEIEETQKNSKNKYAEKYWQLIIENVDGDYIASQVNVSTKTVTNPLGGESVEEVLTETDKQDLSGNIQINYTCGDVSSKKLEEGRKLVITFHKGSEEIERVEEYKGDSLVKSAYTYIVDTSEDTEDAAEKLLLTVKSADSGSSASKTTTIYFNTGKVIAK